MWGHTNKGESANATKRNSKLTKNKKKKCSAVLTICFIASAVYFLFIFLSPYTIYDQFVNVDLIVCKEEFYNSNNSTEKINCKG